jgi:hypothetical protein
LKKRIYIIGAGDFGREMESWLEDLPNFKNEYDDIKSITIDNIICFGILRECFLKH